MTGEGGGPAPGLDLVLARARYELRDRIAQVPTLFLPIARRRRGAHQAVRPETAIVIEGFPRSANTFAFAAFELAQPRQERLHIAHHLHAPAQILQGVRWGLPVLVLVRPAHDAVLSYAARHREMAARGEQADRTPSPAALLRSWLRFYRRVLPYRHRYVLGCFDEVTADYGAVIRRVNDRFGTAFVPFEHTAENVAAAWDREGLHAGPTEQRERIKEAVRRELADPGLAGLLAETRALYGRLTGTGFQRR